MWYVNKDYILIHQTYRIAFTWHYFAEFIKKYAMWKFIVDVVHDFVSSLQPDVGRGLLHVSNVFLLLNRLFGPRSQKTSELRVTGLCAGSSPGTGEF